MSKKSEDRAITDKLRELSELTAWFESDEFSIDKSIDTFKKASALVDEIEKDLANIQHEVTVLRNNFSKE